MLCLFQIRPHKSVFAAKRGPFFFHKKAVHGGTIFLESKRSVSNPSGTSENFSDKRFSLVWKLYHVIPSLKLTWHLKRTPCKKRFLLETIIFRCYVSFRKCTPQKYKLAAAVPPMELKKHDVPQFVSIISPNLGGGICILEKRLKPPPTRWVPTNYKWGYNSYKVITPVTHL